MNMGGGVNKFFVKISFTPLPPYSSGGRRFFVKFPLLLPPDE